MIMVNDDYGYDGVEMIMVMMMVTAMNEYGDDDDDNAYDEW